MNIYKITVGSSGDDKLYYFGNKKIALNWLSKNITDAYDRDIKLDGLPAGYDGKMAKQITNWIKNKQWEKVSPYYSMWLDKIRVQK